MEIMLDPTCSRATCSRAEWVVRRRAAGGPVERAGLTGVLAATRAGEHRLRTRSGDALRGLERVRASELPASLLIGDGAGRALLALPEVAQEAVVELAVLRGQGLGLAAPTALREAIRRLRTSCCRRMVSSAPW